MSLVYGLPGPHDRYADNPRVHQCEQVMNRRSRTAAMKSKAFSDESPSHMPHSVQEKSPRVIVSLICSHPEPRKAPESAVEKPSSEPRGGQGEQLGPGPDGSGGYHRVTRRGGQRGPAFRGRVVHRHVARMS